MCYLYLDWYRCAILISTGVLVLLPACEGNYDAIRRQRVAIQSHADSMVQRASECIARYIVLQLCLNITVRLDCWPEL